MIINTGNRTDIPAYFSEWFYNRIKEGYVYVRNPYYPSQVTRYLLNPQVVDCIAFCTKNPEPMLKRLCEIKDFHQFWFVTITPYGRDVEPYVPDKSEVMDSFIQLSKLLGIHSVSWRYDPIFITEKYSLNFHINTFEKMAEKLAGYTDNCVISFIDLYEKTKRNFPQVRSVTKEEQEILGENFAKIGKKHNITIRSCCEGTELKKFGIDISGCITKEILERAVGATLLVPATEKSNRNECNCLMGKDIGMYNTCGHGCLYCYANYDRKTVLENLKNHHKNSPYLIGKKQPDDIIKDATQKPYYDGQLQLPL